MRFYVASSFNLIREVTDVVSLVERLGHKVSIRWWDVNGFNLHDKKRDNERPETFYHDPICQRIFKRDVKGVRDSDALILVGGSEPKAFNGANIELGLALAWEKPCLSIGKLDNSAMYYPVRRCLNLRALEREIRWLEKVSR